MSTININDVIKFYNEVIIPAATNANVSPSSYMENIFKLVEMTNDGIIKLNRIIPEPCIEEEELHDMGEPMPDELFNLSIDYFPKCGGYPQEDLSNVIIIQKFNSFGKTGDDSILRMTYEDSLIAANAFDKLVEELMKGENKKWPN